MQLLHPLQVPYGMRCVVVGVVVVVVATLTVGLLCCGVRPKFDTLTKDCCGSDANTFQSTTITTQETYVLYKEMLCNDQTRNALLQTGNALLKVLAPS